MAEEAAHSRVQAGVQFPSDTSAGLELGRKVAERVIELAKADGSDAVWAGSVPTGPCKWTGTRPGNVTMPGWKPILLAAANEFRPPVPPDCHSAAVKAETDAVRQFERKALGTGSSPAGKFPQGGPARADHREGQPGDTRGDDRHNAIAREFFMHKFRQLGFIEYNGHLNVHSSLLSVVLHDQPQPRVRM
jgi:hypothetical protein